MPDNSFHAIETLLASAQPDQVRQGLELAKKEIAKIGSSEARPLFEMVSALFYIDPLDRPDLAPLVNEAISLVVGFGKWVIPVLVDKLDAGDIKVQMAVAQALGRIGADAVEPLIAEYQLSDDPARCAFVLYALGKIKSPKIAKAAPLTLEAAKSSDVELRDTATRTIGKLVESIPPLDLPETTRAGFVETLRANLADPSPGIRAKAMRSLGKMAHYGHLSAQEREQLKRTCQLILGQDDNYEWDRAYIVRQQAEEALRYV